MLSRGGLFLEVRQGRQDEDTESLKRHFYLRRRWDPFVGETSLLLVGDDRERSPNTMVSSEEKGRGSPKGRILG